MKKSIWISLAAFAIFVAGALAALAVFLSRRDSKLIGDDDYDEYDFDFDDEDAPVRTPTARSRMWTPTATTWSSRTARTSKRRDLYIRSHFVKKAPTCRGLL